MMPQYHQPNSTLRILAQSFYPPWCFPCGLRYLENAESNCRRPGITNEMYSLIAAQLGRKIKLIEVPEYKDSFSAAVAAMKKYNLTISPDYYSYTGMRARSVNFVLPQIHPASVILVMNGYPFMPSIYFVSPFSLTVWLICALAVALAVLVITLESTDQDWNFRVSSSGNRRVTASVCNLLANWYRLHFAARTESTHHFWSSRLCRIGWSLTAFVLLCQYKSFLHRDMTAPVDGNVKDFDTIERFGNSILKYNLQPVVVSYDWMHTKRMMRVFTVRNALKLRPPVKVASLAKGIKFLSGHPMSVLMPIDDLYAPRNQKESHNLRLIPMQDSTFMHGLSSMALETLPSTLVRNISNGIQMLKERGLYYGVISRHGVQQEVLEARIPFAQQAVPQKIYMEVFRKFFCLAFGATVALLLETYKTIQPAKPRK